MSENKSQVTSSQSQAEGIIKAISISKEKGIKKANVKQAILKEDFGIIGDAHAGTKNRQVSLLAVESIKKMQEKGLKVGPGDFAENITTEGFDLLSLELGDRFRIGKDVELQISQIGKVCHTRCNIYYQAGDCVMPKEGIFVKVLKGGKVKVGDSIKILCIK
ncbi:MAG: molybdenum cofactor sulfurase [Omnitrophica WOR_2 bacterium RIFCSPHIGHO2_02_FULL_45_21]|nr:MAG: molybdenum cofactor sulfurase [Omnitrophica WOR_2 bacterium RIFCSPHIGHO2_02_FULL_45_21]